MRSRPRWNNRFRVSEPCVHIAVRIAERIGQAARNTIEGYHVLHGWLAPVSGNKVGKGRFCNFAGGLSAPLGST